MKSRVLRFRLRGDGGRGGAAAAEDDPLRSGRLAARRVPRLLRGVLRAHSHGALLHAGM